MSSICVQHLDDAGRWKVSHSSQAMSKNKSMNFIRIMRTFAIRNVNNHINSDVTSA